MSEYLGYVISIGTFIGGFFLGQHREKQQNKLNFMLNNFRPLIANLRESIIDVDQTFHRGYVESYASNFDVLFELELNGTLDMFKKIDKELHTKLRTLTDDLIPKLKDTEDSRSEVFKRIQERWIDHLFNPSMTRAVSLGEIEKFVQHLSSKFIWSLWKEDEEEEVKNNYRDSTRHFTKSVIEENTIKIKPLEPYEHYDELKNIAEKEWEELKQCYNENHEKIRKVVSEHIIPKMEKHLSEGL